jgi:hypothetical protein
MKELAKKPLSLRFPLGLRSFFAWTHMALSIWPEKSMADRVTPEAVWG